jgi:hypothetical protein
VLRHKATSADGMDTTASPDGSTPAWQSHTTGRTIQMLSGHTFRMTPSMHCAAKPVCSYKLPVTEPCTPAVAGGTQAQLRLTFTSDAPEQGTAQGGSP